MTRNGRARLALAGVLLLGASGAGLVALSTGAGAADRPATWYGAAEASGFRFSVIKPAQLPTADEVAGLSVPFARAESDSSPAGRAIGSWLWPGETTASAKSLLLVGLDPSAADAERQAREDENPGHGCDPKRTLSTPAVSDPAGAGVTIPPQTIRSPITGRPVYDPTDNPCGEAAARTALQTTVNERVPEYPFWAHSLWPPVSPGDRADRATVCDAPKAFPPAYDLPEQLRSPCPNTGESATGGLIEAISNENGNWATAQVGSFELPGIARAEQITSLARVEWIGNVLLSSATVTIENLSLLAPDTAEAFVHVDTLTSTATIASDDRAPVTSLEASGVTVTLAGSTYEAAIDRDRIRVVDQSLPATVQQQLTAALDALSRRVTFGTCAADATCGIDGADATADASAGAATKATGARARTAGLAISLTESNSAEGATTLRLSFGLAEAAALARASDTFVPPPPPDIGGGYVPPGGNVAQPAPSALGDAVIPGVPQFGRAVPLRGVLPSEPVPAAVVLVAILGMVAGGGALVAAGVWETTT